MKVKKLRVKNYKSILDSGDIYFEEDITIFAGRNESGKTSLLEALEDFDKDASIREDAVPIYSDLVPEITLTLQFKDGDFSEIVEGLGYEGLIKDVKDITLTKKHPSNYSFSEDSLKALGIDKEALDKKIEGNVVKNFDSLKKICEELGEGAIGALPELDITVAVSLPTLLKKFITDNQTQIDALTEKGKEISSLVDKAIEFIGLLENSGIIVNALVEEIKLYIPNFILFSSFDDILPPDIEIDKALETPIVKDLTEISDLSIDTIKSGTTAQKATHKNITNIKLLTEYKKYWTQDITHLCFEWDSVKLSFLINEGGKYYPPNLRSKGMQWHMAFYIKVAARARENVRNIILIDEPGLFLHAKAQKDILKLLEDSAQENPIVFSTHSPYLLEPDKFKRIRLVFKGENGTIVENKIHKLADKETLTPILTAIGLEVSAGITNLDKKNNVVVEGQSDWYYLQAFKLLFGVKDINFIFGGGAGNMPIVGTVLNGWGCEVRYLYDNDKGLKDAEKNIHKHWIIDKSEIMAISDDRGKSIEDILEKSDFKKLVLEEDIEYAESNSEYLKKNNSDKVLFSKLFLSKVESGKVPLSKDSQRTIKELLKNIGGLFK